MVGDIIEKKRKKGKGPKRPPLEPLNTAAAQAQKPVHRLTEGEREQLEKLADDEGAAPEEMSAIKPWLFLGGLADALDLDLANKKGVTHVLNVAKECDSGEDEDESLTYLKLALVDHSDEPICAGFASAFKFINRAKEEEGKVLVHCRRGISRSATIVIAYLMETERMPLNQAFDFVRRKRPIINPNLGFVLSLESFHKQLYPMHEQRVQAPIKRREMINHHLKPLLSINTSDELHCRKYRALDAQDSPSEQEAYIHSTRVEPLLPTPTTLAEESLFCLPPTRSNPDKKICLQGLNN